MIDICALIDYENGTLPEDETVALFQELVDTGLAWQLEGAYARMAIELIRAGDISLPEDHP